MADVERKLLAVNSPLMREMVAEVDLNPLLVNSPPTVTLPFKLVIVEEVEKKELLVRFPPLTKRLPLIWEMVEEVDRKLLEIS